MHCMTNTQKNSGIVEHTNPALGGAKGHHESFDSDNEQSIVGSPLKNIDERQLAIIGQSSTGWI